MLQTVQIPRSFEPLRRTPAALFHPLVDRLLRLDRPDRKAWLAEAAAGLEAFPAVLRGNRDAIVRGMVLHDASNRLALRLQLRFPKLVKSLARFVTIAGAAREVRRVPANRPVIFALMHFGPVVLVFTTLQRLVRGRKTYGLHAGGDAAPILSAALRLLGVEPLVCDERALRTLSKAMASDPNCAVIIAFDYLGRRSRLNAPFLDRSVAASRGLAYLADTFDAAVFTAWGDCSRRGPHVSVGRPYAVDASIASAKERQDALTLRLFRDLETQVRRRPQAWTEWRNAGEAAAT